MSDVEFDAYTSSRVSIVMEHMSVTYDTAVLENWKRNTVEENICHRSHKRRGG